jgi:CheY-like chemotaxis protein
LSVIVDQQESLSVTTTNQTNPLILVVEDVHETRDGIEKLLTTDGYRVSLARDERDAIDNALRACPDLILVSLAGASPDVILSARKIREKADVGEQVPVVVFCIEGIGEGDEVAIGQNVHLTRPDNFNQLRSLLTRLLHKISIAALPPGSAITAEQEFTIMNNGTQKPLTFRFLDTKPRVLLELSNATDNTLRSVEILTIFLKAEDTLDRGPSQSHIRFDAIKFMLPHQTAVMSHRTWINGKPVNDERDQMARLKIIAGELSPYVLDISWEDAEGKARFQRIPVGH